MAELEGMRHFITLAIVGLALANSGCFVFDEIDKGMAMLKKHSPPSNKQGEKVEGDSGLSFAALRERGQNALGDLSVKVEEAMAKAPDPANVVITCETEGRTEYTRKFDCLSRGGRVR